MPLQERWLPLFPLNLVLFPDMTIPLNIFEERYKLMINSCLENDSKFGVVLIKAGQEVGSPAITDSTGTVAYIARAQGKPLRWSGETRAASLHTGIPTNRGNPRAM